MLDKTKKAVEIIQSKINFHPKVGIILGSGLGPLADQIENPVEIEYGKIPGFPVSTVSGHEGKLFLGYLEGIPVACLKGRVHLYENPGSDKIKIMVRSLKLLGCHTLIMANAAGSLNKNVAPGELSLNSDYINLLFTNPLIGPNDDDFGPRFPAMNDAYNKKLREKIKKVAKKINLKLSEGVYLAALGPTFETPAEIRAYKILGADLVGMSTVAETMVAVHCGMKVAAISAVVNFAAGMVETAHSHEETLHFAKVASENLIKLVRAVLKECRKEFLKAALN